MKHYVVVFLFILSNSLFSQSSKWQIHPTDFTNDLYKLYFTDSLTGYICGENGIILKTTDGINWIQKNTPTTNTLRDIFFFNDTLGWACGDSGTIIHTDDAGENWIIQTTGYSKPFVSMEFVGYGPGYYGWAAGDSIEAGKPYNEPWMLGFPEGNFHFITFPPYNNDALVMMSTQLFIAYNIGAIWQYLWTYDYPQFDATFLQNYNIGNWTRNVWMVGENGSAHSMSFPVWGYDSFTPDTLDLFGVAVDEYAHKIWAVGEQGRILLSEDEGDFYYLVESPTTEMLNDIFFSGFNTGYIVGNNGMILVYKDNWVVSDESTSSEIYKMISPNPATTYVYFDLDHYSDIQLSIYNSTGERKFLQFLPSSQTIDVSSLPAGIYVYLLTGKNGFKETGKIVIR